MPAMWSALDHGVIARARTESLWNLHLWDLRKFSGRKDGRVDERPYGGGPGMVLRPQPLYECLQAVQQQSPQPWVIQLDPRAPTLSHSHLKQLITKQHLVLVCGRYEGIDQRFTDHFVNQSISIGPFVCSGGDLPAMILTDSLIRLLPGTLGNPESSRHESYQDTLDHPHYTRPAVFHGIPVPEVLRSGNDALIAQWRRMHALGSTWRNHPELMPRPLSATDAELLAQYQKLYCC